MLLYQVEITPRGIRRSGQPLRERIHETAALLRQSLSIVHANLLVENFGMVLGQTWLILDPLMQAALYFFLFRVILGVQGVDVSLLYIFIAITFWRSHQVLLGAALYLIRARALFFLQISLPLQAAYFEMIGGEIAVCLIRMLVLFAVVLATSGYAGPAWLFTFYILAVQFTFSSALAIWLSIFGTFFRDLSRIVPVALSVWWYASPGMYSIRRVPDSIRWIYDLNPFAYILDAYKAALLEGRVIDFRELTIVLVVSILLAIAGGYALQRARYFFARYL